MIDIKFDGLDDILGKVEELGDTGKYTTVLGKACAVVERDAKINAPKDTGALRRSITSTVEVENGDIVGTVFTPLEYAPYVEYGTGLFAEDGGRTDVPWHYQDDKGNWHTTSGQQPQPFMRPALNDNREKIVRLIKEGISND
jgi:HK97 gp10 family phage protein